MRLALKLAIVFLLVYLILDAACWYGLIPGGTLSQWMYENERYTRPAYVLTFVLFYPHFFGWPICQAPNRKPSSSTRS